MADDSGYGDGSADFISFSATCHGGNGLYRKIAGHSTWRIISAGSMVRNECMYIRTGDSDVEVRSVAIGRKGEFDLAKQ